MMRQRESLPFCSSHSRSGNGYVSAMEIAEIFDRRQRQLARLLKEAGRGSQARLAAELDVNPSYISQLANGIKRIDDELARALEVGAGWPEGTLDANEDGIGEPVRAWEQPEDLPQETYDFIPRFDIRAPGGPGSRVEEDSESHLGQGQAFRRAWLRERHLDPAYLACVYCPGDSMEPVIKEGACMLVNKAETEVQDGKVYVIRYDDELRTKKLYKRPGGGLTIASANPQHTDIDLTAEEAQWVEIVGRVRWSASEH